MNESGIFHAERYSNLMRQFLLRRKKAFLTLENILNISGAVQHANDFDCFRNRAVENNVATEWEAQNSRTEFFSAASCPWLMRQRLNRFMQLVDEGVRIRNTVICDVAPYFNQVRTSPRRYADLRHLFIAARRFLASGGALNCFRVECSGRSTLQTFADVFTKLLQL
jgi:hypothetical protein